MATTITQTIPNLIQGMSQRAAAQRDPTQGDLQINGYSSVSMGLRKRPGAQLLAPLTITQGGAGVLSHAILRDKDEKYLAFFSRTGVSVVTLAGEARTVNVTAGALTYLAAAVNAQTDFKAATVADYTFLSCTRVVPAMANTFFGLGTRPLAHEALIWVRQAAYGELYQVTINGTTISVQAPAEPVLDTGGGNFLENPINVETIAALIDTEAEAIANIESSRNGGVIWIRSANQITIKVPEALDGNLSVITQKVDNAVQLPATAPNGYMVEVVGDATTTYDNYYLQFENDPDTSVVDTIGRGFWREIPAPGIQWQINAATMPHALVRLPTGQFYFGPLDGSVQSGLTLPRWGDRRAGDENTAPEPAFIRTAINDVFIWRNRLCFLAGERVVTSRAGRFFEFWPPTATRVQADDPVEVAAAGTKVSVLRHAVPFQDEVVLFSDQSQFLLGVAGSGILGPGTAEISLLTQYENDVNARPVQVGDAVAFVQPSESNSQLREFRFIPSSGAAVRASAAEMTAQVGSLIPPNVSRLTADNASNFLAVLTRTAGSLHKVFVNKHLWAPGPDGGMAKAQNSWSVWEFGCDEILDVLAVEERLYLVTRYGSGVSLQVVSIEDQLPESPLPAAAVMLDRWVMTTTDSPAGVRLPAGVYNATTNTTTWTLPYTIPNGRRHQVITDPRLLSYGTAKVLGEATSGTTITAFGNWATTAVAAGAVYKFLYRFSEFRLAAGNQSNTARSSVRIQLRKALLRYHKSLYFIARVANKGRTPAEYVYSPQILDSQLSELLPLDDGQYDSADPRFIDGVFPIPLMANTEHSSLELESEAALPCCFLSLDWQALVSGRGAVRRAG